MDGRGSLHFPIALWPSLAQGNTGKLRQASDARIRLKSSLRGWLHKNRTKVAGGPNRDIAAAKLCHNGNAILPVLRSPRARHNLSWHGSTITAGWIGVMLPPPCRQAPIYCISTRKSLRAGPIWKCQRANGAMHSAGGGYRLGVQRDRSHSCPTLQGLASLKVHWPPVSRNAVFGAVNHTCHSDTCFRSAFLHTHIHLSGRDARRNGRFVGKLSHGASRRAHALWNQWALPERSSSRRSPAASQRSQPPRLPREGQTTQCPRKYEQRAWSSGTALPGTKTFTSAEP